MCFGDCRHSGSVDCLRDGRQLKVAIKISKVSTSSQITYAIPFSVPAKVAAVKVTVLFVPDPAFAATVLVMWTVFAFLSAPPAFP